MNNENSSCVSLNDTENNNNYNYYFNPAANDNEGGNKVDTLSNLPSTSALKKINKETSEITISDKNQIIEAESELTPQKIIDANYQDKELLAANDNMSPNLPTDPKNMGNYIIAQEQYIKMEEKILKKIITKGSNYSNALASVQNHAYLLLLAQQKIGEEIKSIKGHQGSRSDLSKKFIGKLDFVKEKFGLNSKQARDFPKLTVAAINDALKYSIANQEIPNRAMALSFIPRDCVKNESGSFTCKPIIEEVDKTLNLENPIYYTSLFANIGIGTFYLHDLNLHCAVANELLPERAEWHDAIYKGCKVVQGSITDDKIFDQLVDEHLKKGCQMVLASPPCQTFSKANTSKKKAEDSRNTLIQRTLEFVKKTNPNYVMIENVPEFLGSKPQLMEEILKDRTIGDYISDELKAMGYSVNIGIFSAADYGTPQDRRRAIILACKKKFGLWKFPKKDTERKMLFEAIADLPSLKLGEHDPKRPLHYAFDVPECQINFLKHTPTAHSAWENTLEFRPVNTDGEESGAKFKSSFQRKDWGKPCNTITSDCYSISGKITIHPGRPLSDGTYSDCRPLSILELLRVTGLPDDYPIPAQFLKNEQLICTVIGECFAPLHVKRLMSTLPVPVKDPRK